MATRPRPVRPRPDDTIKAFETIRRKASFLANVLDSDVDLSDEGDRHELAGLAYQIFEIADTVLGATKGGK